MPILEVEIVTDGEESLESGLAQKIADAAGDAIDLKSETANLCEAIARACGRPKENVHILHLPEAAGRMSFGGELVSG